MGELRDRGQGQQNIIFQRILFVKFLKKLKYKKYG